MCIFAKGRGVGEGTSSERHRLWQEPVGVWNAVGHETRTPETALERTPLVPPTEGVYESMLADPMAVSEVIKTQYSVNPIPNRCGAHPW